MPKGLLNIAAKLLSSSVDCPRRPCPGLKGENIGNPARRISCSRHQPCRSCSLPSLVMETLCVARAAAPLPTAAHLSDSAADHVPVSAVQARLGRLRQPRLRSVLTPGPLSDSLPQVLDYAQDLAAQQPPVEPASPGQPKVLVLPLSQVLHLHAQALPVDLPRPHRLPGSLPAVSPRQLQVVLHPAAQPDPLPAGRLAAATYLAAAAHPAAAPYLAAPAAPLPARQQPPHHQVVHRPYLQLAHAAAQVLARLDPHRDQVPAPPVRPRLPASRLPASSSWILPARSVTQVASGPPPCLNLPTCLCSVYPAVLPAPRLLLSTRSHTSPPSPARTRLPSGKGWQTALQGHIYSVLVQ